MKNSVNHTDVAIIGAGPIGIELAVALKRAGIDCLLFDKGQIGQTIYWFPPQTRFFSSNDRIGIAGVPLQTVDQSKATREEYLAYLRSIATYFDLDLRTYEEVISIEPAGRDGFVLISNCAAGEMEYRARRVVLTTGGTAGPRMLEIPGEDLDHVSHYFEDPHKYFRKQVLIVGGNNSAVEAALRCYHAGAQVAISYRRSGFKPKSVKYWLLPELEGRIRRGEIKGYLNTQPTAISTATVTLANLDEGDPFDVPADFVLLMTGYVADMSLFRKTGVKLEGPDETPVFDERTMETNLPGIYVAGTAVAGTQVSYKIFIENCHVHTERICAALQGLPPPADPEKQILPES
jgi:thioredoxin reductase (NADPH)